MRRNAHLPTLLALAAGYFVVGIASMSVIGLSVPLTVELGMPASAVGGLVTAFAITYALAAPAMQIFFGAHARRRLIMTGLVIVFAGCAVCALSTDYGVLVAGRIVMALGAGLVGPTVSATGAALVSEHERSAALALVFGGMTAAVVVGVPVCSVLGLSLGWRGVMWLIGGIALATALAAWATVPRTARGVRTGARMMLRMLADRKLGMALLVPLMQMSAVFATYALLGPWMAAVIGNADGSLPASAVPTAMFIYGAGGLVGNALGAWIERRVGAFATLRITLIALGAGFAAALVVPGGLWPLYVLMGVWAVTAMSFMAPQQKRLVDLAGDRAGLALALNASALYVGISAGSSAGVAVHGSYGPGMLPVASLIFTALALLALQVSRGRRPA
ncbi:MFS transporter [Tistrella bauzanensis]|jgi:DHA1 family inner membrane transport protein|uniref:MFS transporter n=1 Tax=Tistrella arctica TaxID=3133430 RepID=A0ABU9YN47_9PROT